MGTLLILLRMRCWNREDSENFQSPIWLYASVKYSKFHLLFYRSQIFQVLPGLIHITNIFKVLYFITLMIDQKKFLEYDIETYNLKVSCRYLRYAKLQKISKFSHKL